MFNLGYKQIVINSASVVTSAAGVVSIEGYGKFKIPNLSLKQKTIIKGDASVFLIAAASIIAKVSRDRFMKSADNIIMFVSGPIIKQI